MDPRHKAEDDTYRVVRTVSAKIVILGLVPRIHGSANSHLDYPRPNIQTCSNADAGPAMLLPPKFASSQMDPRHKAEADTYRVVRTVPAKIVILGLVPRIQGSANTGH